MTSPVRQALLLAVLLLTVLPAPVTAEDDPAWSLYFHQGLGLHKQDNFTTIPPSTDEPGDRVRFLQDDLHTEDEWMLPYLPADWAIPRDSQGEARLFLSGLDQIAATPSSEQAPPDLLHWDPTQLHLSLLVHTGAEGDRLVGEGHAWQELRPDAPRNEPLLVTIPLQFDGGISQTGAGPPDGASVFITIKLAGRNVTGISPIHLHFGSASTPSAVALPGFPYEELHAWDLHANGLSCTQAILRQTPCHSPTSADTRDGVAANPLLVVFLLASAASRRYALREREAFRMKTAVVRTRPRDRHIDEDPDRV